MNLAIPAASSGPQAPQGGGDGGHSRGNKGIAQDFAAALSETAGEQGKDQGKGGDIAKAVKAAQSPRLSDRVDGKERGPTEGRADPVFASDMPADVAETEAHALEAANTGEAAGAPEANPASNGAAAAGAQTPAGAMRDVLASLRADTPALKSKPVSLDDLVSQISKHLPAGARTAATAAPDPASQMLDLSAAAELAATIVDEDVVVAKVVRLETHFQPVGQDARRMFGMGAVAGAEVSASADPLPASGDGRLLQASIAAAAKTGRQGAGERGRQDMPAMAARLSDAAATAAVAAAGGEPAAGTIGQQIADGVQRAMAASPSSEANGTRPAPATGAIAGTFAPAVRTIKLQLNPLSLGTVTIVLTGRDSELSIKIEAERAETVSGVEQERGALTSRLAGAGYAISELTVARMGAASAEGDQRESGSRFASQQQGDGAGGRAAQENAAQSGDRGAGREPDSGRSAARSADTPAARGGVLEQVVSGISYSGRFRPV